MPLTIEENRRLIQIIVARNNDPLAVIDEDKDFLQKLFRKIISEPAKTFAEVEDYDKLLERIGNEIDLNAIDENGDTALMQAAATLNVEAIEYLLNKFADLKIVNKERKTFFTILFSSLTKEKLQEDHEKVRQVLFTNQFKSPEEYYHYQVSTFFDLIAGISIETEYNGSTLNSFLASLKGNQIYDPLKRFVESNINLLAVASVNPQLFFTIPPETFYGLKFKRNIPLIDYALLDLFPLSFENILKNKSLDFNQYRLVNQGQEFSLLTRACQLNRPNYAILLLRNVKVARIDVQKICDYAIQRIISHNQSENSKKQWAQLLALLVEKHKTTPELLMESILNSVRKYLRATLKIDTERFKKKFEDLFDKYLDEIAHYNINMRQIIMKYLLDSDINKSLPTYSSEQNHALLLLLFTCSSSNKDNAEQGPYFLNNNYTYQLNYQESENDLLLANCISICGENLTDAGKSTLYSIFYKIIHRYALKKDLPQTARNYEEDTAALCQNLRQYALTVFNKLLEGLNLEEKQSKILSLSNECKAACENLSLFLLALNKDSECLYFKAPNVNIAGINQDTALHLAARNNNLDAIKELFTYEALNPNAQNSQENTALHLAALKGDVRVIDILAYQINLAIKNNEGQNAFQAAMSSTNLTDKEKHDIKAIFSSAMLQAKATYDAKVLAYNQNHGTKIESPSFNPNFTKSNTLPSIRALRIMDEENPQAAECPTSRS